MDVSQPLDPREPGVVASSLLYETANEAVKADFHYWTGRLTETSVQLSYAVIAANWAVFGSLDQIRRSSWSKISITLVVGSLGLSVFAAKWMGELHNKQLNYAREHKDEFAGDRERDPHWPFTRGIVISGWVFRELRAWLPLAAGLSFLIALLSRY